MSFAVHLSFCHVCVGQFVTHRICIVKLSVVEDLKGLTIKRYYLEASREGLPVSTRSRFLSGLSMCLLGFVY